MQDFLHPQYEHCLLWLENTVVNHQKTGQKFIRKSLGWTILNHFFSNKCFNGMHSMSAIAEKPVTILRLVMPTKDSRFGDWEVQVYPGCCFEGVWGFHQTGSQDLNSFERFRGWDCCAGVRDITDQTNSNPDNGIAGMGWRATEEFQANACTHWDTALWFRGQQLVTQQWFYFMSF